MYLLERHCSEPRSRLLEKGHLLVPGFLSRSFYLDSPHGLCYKLPMERIQLLAEHASPGPHRVTLGGSPIKGGGMFYGTAIRCRCGWKFQSNGPPSRDGNREWVQAKYTQHLAEVVKELQELVSP